MADEDTKVASVPTNECSFMQCPKCGGKGWFKAWVDLRRVEYECDQCRGWGDVPRPTAADDR